MLKKKITSTSNTIKLVTAHNLLEDAFAAVLTLLLSRNGGVTTRNQKLRKHSSPNKIPSMRASRCLSLPVEVSRKTDTRVLNVIYFKTELKSASLRLTYHAGSHNGLKKFALMLCNYKPSNNFSVNTQKDQQRIQREHATQDNEKLDTLTPKMFTLTISVPLMKASAIKINNFPAC